MPITGYPSRPYIRQPFPHFPFSVQVAALPISADQNLVAQYVDTFVVNVPAAAANSVFIGSSGVTIATGLELTQGNIYTFKVNQDGRQLYELQDPLLQLAKIAQCDIAMPEMIPFVCWDLSQIFLVATAITDVRIAFFANQFV